MSSETPWGGCRNNLSQVAIAVNTISYEPTGKQRLQEVGLKLRLSLVVLSYGGQLPAVGGADALHFGCRALASQLLRIHTYDDECQRQPHYLSQFKLLLLRYLLYLPEH